MLAPVTRLRGGAGTGLHALILTLVDYCSFSRSLSLKPRKDTFTCFVHVKSKPISLDWYQ